MNVCHQKFLPRDFLEFIGNGIGMPMNSGNKIFETVGHLKFGRTKNSWENAGSI